MNWYREIATNTLFQIVARIASSGSTFLITIIIARGLGIIGYGDFAKINGFVSFFYLFADFGLNAIFLQKNDSKVRFKELFYTRLSLSVGLILLINALSWLLPYNSVTHVGFSPAVRLGINLFSLTIITEAITYTTAAVFQRELSYEYFMISSVVGSVATLLFVFAATTFTYSIFFIILSYVLGGIIESGTALFFTKEGILPLRVDIAYVKKLTLETLPVTLMLIFNLVYFRIDLILLSLLKSSADVAVYDLSYKFFDFLIALPLFLSNALYPTILKQEELNKNFGSTIKKYLLLFVAFSLFVLIPMWIFAPLLGLIRKDFIAAVVPFRILILSLPIFFATSILQWVLLAKKKQKFLAVIYFVSAAFNIAGNLLFIPAYSYVAASIITGIGEALVFVALWIKLFGVRVNRLVS